MSFEKRKREKTEIVRQKKKLNQEQVCWMLKWVCVCVSSTKSSRNMTNLFCIAWCVMCQVNVLEYRRIYKL